MNTTANMSMPTLKVAGVVLCGGRSSRMGRDKSRLKYRGLALSEHMSSLLQLAGITDVFISGPDGIPDALPGLGPLGGIHACAEAMAGKFTHAVFVPVDMPLLSLQRLRMLAFNSSTAEALQYTDQMLPLRLSLSAQTVGSLAAQLAEHAQSRRSIKDFIRSLHNDSLPLGHADLEFTNINTPQDWQALGHATPLIRQ